MGWETLYKLTGLECHDEAPPLDRLHVQLGVLAPLHHQRVRRLHAAGREDHLAAAAQGTTGRARNSHLQEGITLLILS